MAEAARAAPALDLPALAGVRRRFPRPRVADVAAETRRQLASLGLERLAGRRVALTAGSRGIRDVAAILRAAVDALREAGAEPVVVAAMGSHGGGTAEGQGRLLAHLGVTAESVGAPVLSGMEVVEVGRTAAGLVCYCDRHAWACDAIVVVNRIKPHTGFRTPFGSGLLKMLAVGLGKAPGAAQIHRQGSAAMARAIRDLAGILIGSGRVFGGLAIVENGYDETARLEAIPPAAIADREVDLFRMASDLMPALPVDEADLLIVDEIGKNYSGTGMDVNVIGRWRLEGVAEPERPRFGRIVALRLSAASEGNAQGVGLADVVTRRLADAVDWRATYLNTITSTFVQRGFLPIVMPSDREAIAAALRSLGVPDPRAARVVRIRNTLALDRLWVSESLAAAVARAPGVVEVGECEPLAFDAAGDLLP